MVTKTFYAIYNTRRKQFKGRGNISGARWSEFPTQTYDANGRATSALKLHIQALKQWNRDVVTEEYVIKPITISWEE